MHLAMEYVGCIWRWTHTPSTHKCAQELTLFIKKLEQKRHKFSTFRPDLDHFDQTAQNKKLVCVCVNVYIKVQGLINVTKSTKIKKTEKKIKAVRMVHIVSFFWIASRSKKMTLGPWVVIG